MTASIFAPPELFSAFAIVNWGHDVYPGVDLDPEIAKGCHLRILAGGGKSFPLAPFAVFRIKSQPTDLQDLITRGATNPSSTGFTFGESPVDFTPIELKSYHLVRLDLASDEIRDVKLFDQRGRLMQRRVRPRWSFSAPSMRHFRAVGTGAVSILPRSINDDILAVLNFDINLVDILGFPAARDTVTPYNWYLAVETDADGLGRVLGGAPPSLNIMDPIPTTGDIGISPDQEVARIEKMLAMDYNLRDVLAQMLDGEQAPWDQLSKIKGNDKTFAQRQTIHVPPAAALQIAATDPSMARYLGFAATFPNDVPNIDDKFSAPDGRDWDTYAVIGLLAYDPAAYAGLGLDLQPPAPGTAEAYLQEALKDRLGQSITRWGNSIDPSLIDDRIKAVTARGLTVQAFLTFATPLPPAEPPWMRKPRLADHRWQQGDGQQPSDAYRASFLFDYPPHASMIAVRRNSVTRHVIADVPHSAARAIPKVLGYAQAPFDPSAKTTYWESSGLISDNNIPSADGSATYTFNASDLFGRFGVDTTLDLAAPDRPLPPKPVLRFSLDEINWTLRIAAAVPAAGDIPFSKDDEFKTGGLVVVPRLEDMPAGCYPISSVDVTFGDKTQTINVTTPGFPPAITFPLPGLQPQNKADFPLKGLFKDAAGRQSAEAATVVHVIDRRPPTVIPTGVGLFWTGVARTSPEVSFRLQWSGSPNALYRVYLTDELGLDLQSSDFPQVPADQVPTRPEIATAGCNLVVNQKQRVHKERFHLLTNDPIKVSNGNASFAGTLPRSVSTVQFLRIVPVTEAGEEADFNDCGIVPIAVPETRSPPPPTLSVNDFDPEGGTGKLEIIADGFDRARLLREEPGIFDGGTYAHFPQVRIRRAVGQVMDPVYAKVVTSQDMKLVETADGSLQFRSIIPIEPLEPVDAR